MEPFARQGSEEKPKSAENQKHQMVFTVPRVRTDFKQGRKKLK